MTSAAVVVLFLAVTVTAPILGIWWGVRTGRIRRARTKSGGTQWISGDAATLDDAHHDHHDAGGHHDGHDAGSHGGFDAGHGGFDGGGGHH